MSTSTSRTERPSIPVTGPSKMRPVYPGELLGELLEDSRVSLTEAARRLHTSRMSLHRIIKGQQPITPGMALKLGKLMGNGPGLWLRMQTAYDLAVLAPAMAAELETIEPIVA